MMGNRISSWPIAQFCPKAPKLSSVGSGRSAATSNAIHALWGGTPNAADMLARLTDEEREEAEGYEKPTDVNVGGQLLRYDDAAKEATVAITWAGAACKETDPKCWSVGHVDMYWIVDFPDGTRVVYVGDLKRSEWTTTDGPNSLQLIGYGMALAEMHMADAFTCGIWALSEAVWEWGPMHALDAPETKRLIDRCLAAARNTTGDYGRGAHCMGCHGRLQCPAYLLPPEVAITSLSPFTEGGEPITGDNILYALNLAKRAKDTADAVIASCKAAAKQGLPILDPETGKVYKPCVSRGRESIDKEALKASGVDIPMKRGAAFDTFRWVNP